MSMAASPVLNGSTAVALASNRSKTKLDDDKIKSSSNNSNNNNNSKINNNNNSDVLNSSLRSLEASFNVDRQPQAPRRSISPVQRRPPMEDGIDTTQKSANSCFNSNDSDGESSTVDEDLEYIAQLYGQDFVGEESKPDVGSCLRTSRASPDPGPELPPPPLRHITEYESSPDQKFGKTKHDYDKTREPTRSAMRKPNTKSRNVNSIDNTQHRNNEIVRGVTRNHSAEGTDDTRRGSGSLHSVRMRGSIYPVQQRRRSIGFTQTVRVQEVTPTVELNDGNTRELWLQEDEAMEIKERRRTLLRRYKEREARKKREAEHRRREKEMIQRQQKVKNLLNTSKTNKTNFVAQNAAAKKHPRWNGLLKKSDLPLPGATSPSGRRWKATIQNEHPSVAGLSVPSRGGVDPPFTGLYTGNTPSSFMSTSSGGSSLSGHDSDSFRGLEKYIDRSGKHQKNMVWDAVFVEQDEQLQFGYYDDERIASLYRTVQNQHDGQKKAEGRARKDRQAADSYLMTPRTMKLVNDTIKVSEDDLSHLVCGDLLSNIPANTAIMMKRKNGKKKKNSDKKVGDTNDKNSKGLGNHGKTDTTDKNDANVNGDNASAGGTAALKGGVSLKNDKRFKKFMRRLSV